MLGGEKILYEHTVIGPGVIFESSVEMIRMGYQHTDISSFKTSLFKPIK
jgi:hypothetical protein